MSEAPKIKSRGIERTVESLLFASRWFLVPLYLGLALLLLAFSVIFAKEAYHLIATLFQEGEGDLVLAALSLIDLVLVANLVVMVILSGYENFVSTIDVAREGDSLSWMGKVDAGTLKLKLAVSIVAISSIHLLKAFMNVEKIANDKMMWMVILHMTFVLSGLALAILDKIAFAAHREH
jgi:uncharacterized protein (TIGR00645 family)